MLQIRFRSEAPMAEYEQLCLQVAPEFNNVRGLIWKIWTFDENTQMGSGIYLFESEFALAAYLAGPIVASVKSGQFGLRDVEIWHQSVHDAPTFVTRGPVMQANAHGAD